MVFSVQAQEFLKSSFPREQNQGREIQPESLPYTIKQGDFRLLITPSLELDWSDNVTLSRNDEVDDFILRPLVRFDGSYPISRRNLLRFNVGIGYDLYLNHDQYSALRLVSGSEISFDTYIKDFVFNVHDRFSYVQDPAEQAAVASTARYGGLQNDIGIAGTWDLKDLYIGAGFDHENFVSSTKDYRYLDRATEIPSARLGLKLHPTVTAGVEGAGAFTTYDLQRLNDSKGYAAGVFADWRPGSYFRVQARGGYTALFFEQTSTITTAVDQDTWYADLTLSHEPTEAISYSLSLGHELRLGTDADWVEDWYVRPSLNWRIIRNLSLSSYLSYEHGDQGQSRSGSFSETYDWLGAGLSLNQPVTKHLMLTLRYRATVRSSDRLTREYMQNLVGLRATYQFQ